LLIIHFDKYDENQNSLALFRKHLNTKNKVDLSGISLWVTFMKLIIMALVFQDSTNHYIHDFFNTNIQFCKFSAPEKSKVQDPWEPWSTATNNKVLSQILYIHQQQLQLSARSLAKIGLYTSVIWNICTNVITLGLQSG